MLELVTYCDAVDCVATGSVPLEDGEATVTPADGQITLDAEWHLLPHGWTGLRDGRLFCPTHAQEATA